MSIEELARETGIPERTLRAYRDGTRVPPEGVREKLAAALANLVGGLPSPGSRQA